MALSPEQLARLRQRLLADAETRSLAATLGAPLEAYVERVLAYAADAHREPALKVADEARARAAGEKLSTLAEVQLWLRKVAGGGLGPVPGRVADGFVAARRPDPTKPKLDGEVVGPMEQIQHSDGDADPELKRQISERGLSDRSGKKR